MDARSIKRGFYTLLAALGVGLVLVAVFLLSRTAQNSDEFDRLHNIILAINVAGVFLLFILLVGNLARLWRDYRTHVPGARLKTTARDLAISLREARSSAISSGSRIDLTLHSEPMSYAVGNESAVQLPSGVIMTAHDYLAAADASLSDSNALTDEDIVIRFFPDGSSNGAVVKMANSGTSYRVDVSWLMGDIRVTKVGEHDL